MTGSMAVRATFGRAPSGHRREGVTVERVRQLGGSLAGTLQRFLQEERFRQWRQQGGPAPSYRRIVRHPLLVAAGVTIVVGGILATTFGIPPLSPLFLLVVVVAPVPFWLRVEHRILAAWDAGPDASPEPGDLPGDGGGPEPAGPPDAEQG